MYAVRLWSFLKDETFGAVAPRHYRNHLPTEIPIGTESKHFCCDQQGNLRSVSITVVNPQESFSLYHNKVGLLNILCETWCDEEQLEPTLSSTRLHLGDGFMDETKGLLVTAGIVADVAEINTARDRHESHTTFHIQCSERVYGRNYDSRKLHRHCRYVVLFNVAERFVGTVGSHSYLSTNPYAFSVALCPATSLALLFIRCLSGRDTKSYPYFTGKKTCVKSSMQVYMYTGIGGLRRWRPSSRSDHCRNCKAGKIARGLSL